MGNPSQPPYPLGKLCPWLSTYLRASDLPDTGFPNKRLNSPRQAPPGRLSPAGNRASGIRKRSTCPPAGLRLDIYFRKYSLNTLLFIQKDEFLRRHIAKGHSGNRCRRDTICRDLATEKESESGPPEAAPRALAPPPKVEVSFAVLVLAKTWQFGKYTVSLRNPSCLRWGGNTQCKDIVHTRTHTRVRTHTHTHPRTGLSASPSLPLQEASLGCSPMRAHAHLPPDLSLLGAGRIYDKLWGAGTQAYLG